jgi:hypothetical protein
MAVILGKNPHRRLAHLRQRPPVQKRFHCRRALRHFRVKIVADEKIHFAAFQQKPRIGIELMADEDNALLNARIFQRPAMPRLPPATL